MRFRRALALLCLSAALAGGVGAGCSGCDAGRPEAGEVWRVIEARRERFEVTLRETGELRPRDAIIVPGPISGEIVDIVDEGVRVRPGDLLGSIDDTRSREAVERESAEMKARTARLGIALSDRALLERTLAAERRLKEIDLERAQFQLRALSEAPTPYELRSAELKTSQTLLKEEAAQREFERKAPLAERGVIPGTELAQARLEWERARAEREKAELELDLTASGADPQDIAIARERVRQAEVRLRLLDNTTSAQLALKDAAVAVARAELDQTSQTLDRHRRIMASAEFHAPAEGVVLYNAQWGKPEEGKWVWKGDPFLDIVNLSRMQVDARVNEVDVSLIGVGQRARVRLEAFPDRTFPGVVTRVGDIAADRSERRQGLDQREMSGVMEFDVTILIEEDDPDLRPTMTANVDIVVDERENAIAVPWRAVVERDDRTFVYVMEDGRPVARDVRLGLAGASRVVVGEGLEEGDRVCLLRRNR